MQKADARERYLRKCRNLMLVSLLAVTATWVFALVAYQFIGISRLPDYFLPLLVSMHVLIVAGHNLRRAMLDQSFGFEEVGP